MIPFLKHAKEASSSGSIESIERKPDNEPEYDSLESAAEDLKQALEKGDVKAIAMALRSAFDLCDSEPHEEGLHTNG